MTEVGYPCPGHGGGGVPGLGNIQSCLETHLQMGELRPIKATKTRSKYPAPGCSHCFWEQGTWVGGAWGREGTRDPLRMDARFLIAQGKEAWLPSVQGGEGVRPDIRGRETEAGENDSSEWGTGQELDLNPRLMPEWLVTSLGLYTLV